MTIYLSALVAVIGLVVYFASNPQNPKVGEAGRIAFWVGLLVFLWTFAGVEKHVP
jgi:hypothetical protein